ncbi:MAG: hypothetical protein NTZ27_07725 [Ignavibacteriales bacterium]|nr:hypothetical protein [Ignavibacteriales bacterium]
MKTNFLAVILLIICAACSSNKQELTQQDKDQIKKELLPVVSNLITSYELGNVESILKFYRNSADFISVNADGAVNDFPKFKIDVEEQFKAMSTMKLTVEKEEFRILKKDLVLYVWLGKIEGKMRDGSLLVINKNVASFLFQKFNEEWKVIYKGASALPEIIQQSNTANKKK